MAGGLPGTAAAWRQRTPHRCLGSFRVCLADTAVAAGAGCGQHPERAHRNTLQCIRSQDAVEHQQEERALTPFGSRLAQACPVVSMNLHGADQMLTRLSDCKCMAVAPAFLAVSVT